MSTNIIYKELSHTIIGVCMRVHTKLGAGLPEHCYSRALFIEFSNLGLPVSREHKVLVNYNDQPVGHLIPDLVIDNKIILELKSLDSIYPHHLSQLFSYLKASRLKVGYVVNFGTKSLNFKRLIL